MKVEYPIPVTCRCVHDCCRGFRGGLERAAQIVQDSDPPQSRFELAELIREELLRLTK